jgi:hypothetical protein
MQKIIVALTLVLLILGTQSVLAQGDDPPPVDLSSAWGEVVNLDGSINYNNLTDVGVVTESVDWMPSIPLIGDIPAEYHVYTTPSGNTIVLPNTTTMFFMMLNPSDSGLTAANANYGNALAGLTALLTGAGTFPTDSVEASQFADALIAGETNIWSLGFSDVFNLLSFLADASINDMNLYNLALLYTPSSCFAVPGGCPVDLTSLFPPEIIPPPPARSCPDPVVSPGRIIRSGMKVSPNYPLVVGQDPDKTGVTVQFSAHVEPTIYTFWTLEPIEECTPKPWPQTGQDCEIVDWYCEEHTQTYPECISLASGTLRLTQESKDWILNTLSIRYPEAYVHHPTFSFPASTGCSWSYLAHNVPVADPGDWDIYINGQTSGTPVSAARPFGGPAGEFEVWLKETAIIK